MAAKGARTELKAAAPSSATAAAASGAAAGSAGSAGASRASEDSGAKSFAAARPAASSSAGAGAGAGGSSASASSADNKSATVVTEIQGDLFSCPAACSLAHCVSRDLRMGKGIAVLFKDKFGSVDELKAQNKGIGDVAVLRVGTSGSERFIYYLITKERYFHKPTYADLRKSLVQLRKHCDANKVTDLAMPRIGSGLDQLEWAKVLAMLEDVFAGGGVRVLVYYM